MKSASIPSMDFVNLQNHVKESILAKTAKICQTAIRQKSVLGDIQNHARDLLQVTADFKMIVPTVMQIFLKKHKSVNTQIKFTSLNR